jgi:hypothetical protein
MAMILDGEYGTFLIGNAAIDSKDVSLEIVE